MIQFSKWQCIGLLTQKVDTSFELLFIDDKCNQHFMHNSILTINTHSQFDLFYLFKLFVQFPKFASVCVNSEEVTCSQKAHSNANSVHGATFILHFGYLKG